MPIFDAKSIPAEGNSGTKDPEVAAFRKPGQCSECTNHRAAEWMTANPVERTNTHGGRIEHLVLDGRHGNLPVH